MAEKTPMSILQNQLIVQSQYIELLKQQLIIQSNRFDDFTTNLIQIFANQNQAILNSYEKINYLEQNQIKINQIFDSILIILKNDISIAQPSQPHQILTVQSAISSSIWDQQQQQQQQQQQHELTLPYTRQNFNYRR